MDLGLPAELSFLSSFAEEERADCFTLVVFLLWWDASVVSLGAVGWSSVCGCGVSWSISLTFCSKPLTKIAA